MRLKTATGILLMVLLIGMLALTFNIDGGYVLASVGWRIERADWYGDVGLYTSIAVNSFNKPYISYYDYSNHDLKYAYRDGGWWHKAWVDKVGDVGLYTSIALDSGNIPHISYYDLTNGDLKYAYYPEAPVGDVMVITYNYGYETWPGTHNVEEALVEAGYMVNALYNPEDGVIASTLAANDYDQIYLFDFTEILGLTDAGDKASLATWYSNHRGNIVIDGRSYGIYFDYDKDKELIENIAHAFSFRGGGLWIGVDHKDDVDWTKNGNALLSEIGYETVTGIYYSVITGGDTACELLSNPNPIIPSTLWVDSVGGAPTGIQPDGVNLRPLLWSDSTVYTSYALRQTRIYVDPYFNGVEVGDRFSINIDVENVDDLYTYGFTLAYPPYMSKLVVAEVAEGPFLRQGGDTFFVYSINPFSGEIMVGGTLLDIMASGVSGSGTLATITFQCVAPGECALDLKDTYLIDSLSESIPHAVDDGYAYNGFLATVKGFAPRVWKIILHPDIRVKIKDPDPSTIDSTTIKLWHTGPDSVQPYNWNPQSGRATFDGSQVLTTLIDGAGLYTLTITFEDSVGTPYLVKRIITVIP